MGTFIEQTTIKEGTRKILVHGDREAPFIKAYMNLPMEQRNELDKVLHVQLWDGYKLMISEAK